MQKMENHRRDEQDFDTKRWRSAQGNKKEGVGYKETREYKEI